jgi:hypothetical protein
MRKYIQKAVYPLAMGILCLSIIGCNRAGKTETTDQPPQVAYLPVMDHVGIIVRDADKEADKLVANFGATIKNKVTMDFPIVIYRGNTLSYSAYFVFVNMGNATIEYIQPDMTVPSPYLDILNKEGESAHHLCFLVENIKEHLDKFALNSPKMEVVVDVQVPTGKGGDMVYVKNVIPGTLIELATLPK